MAHYLLVPINETGIIFDPDMGNVVQEAIAEAPFGFEDVYVYSHGWSTNAYGAMDTYNRFSTDLARAVLLAAAANLPALVNAPKNPLGIGIHWPSEITEDPASDLNVAQLFTFYTMEQRADTVGRNAVYSMLRLILTARVNSTTPLRIFLLGHSFGCKVVCSALDELQKDVANGTIPLPANVAFRAVLLEPATDNDNLEPGDIYGNVASVANLRVLMTTSSLDKALTTWYPAAAFAANLFHHGARKSALGAAGPTDVTVAAFGGAGRIAVTSGFAAAQMTSLDERLVVADLSPVHESRVAAGLYNGGFSGSHSDISFDEVYAMIIGFLFA